MRSGGFPGQREALLELVRQKEKRAQRRMFLAAGGALALGAGGGLAGGALLRGGATPDRGVRSVAPDCARLIAMSQSSISQLRGGFAAYLGELSRTPGATEEAWLGFVLLAALCLDGDPATQPGLRRALVVAAEENGDPPPMASLLLRRLLGS